MGFSLWQEEAKIVGYEGPPGSGKTLAMVRDAYTTRKHRPERDIYANFDLWLPGRTVWRFNEVEELFDLECCHVYLDEAQDVVNARDWKILPPGWRGWVGELRKADVALRFTTHDINEVDSTLRRKTFGTYRLESFKRFGFFYYQFRYGSREANKTQWRGIWLFNRRVAECYSTTKRIRLKGVAGVENRGGCDEAQRGEVGGRATVLSDGGSGGRYGGARAVAGGNK